MGTSIQDKSWIYHQFWTSTGDPRSPSCELDIPYVFIFRNGLPVRCLGTDFNTKCVIRVPFLERTFEREVGKAIVESNSNRAIESMRQFLIEYGHRRGYTDAQGDIERPKVCTAFYMDGNREDLDMWTFDILLQNDLWRLQIHFVQSYVYGERELKGYHSSSIQEVIKTEPLKEKAHKLAKALSTYCEKAYKVTTDTMLEGISAVQLKGMEVRVRVRDMEAQFKVDHRKRLVFIATGSLGLDIKGAIKEMEAFVSSECDARAATSCLALEQELVKTMRHGERRNFGVDQTFEHFDPNHEGFVNAVKLVKGFGELGLGAVMTVAERLVEKIGGVGARFFTVEQMETYYKTAEYMETAVGQTVDWGALYLAEQKRVRREARQKEYMMGTVKAGGASEERSGTSIRQVLDIAQDKSHSHDDISMLSGGVGSPQRTGKPPLEPVKNIRDLTLPLKRTQPKKPKKMRVSYKDMMAGLADHDSDSDDVGLPDPEEEEDTPVPSSAGGSARNGKSGNPLKNSRRERRRKQAADELSKAPALAPRAESGQGAGVVGHAGASSAPQPRGKGQVDLVGIRHSLVQESVLPPEQVLHVDNGTLTLTLTLTLTFFLPPPLFIGNTTHPN